MTKQINKNIAFHEQMTFLLIYNLEVLLIAEKNFRIFLNHFDKSFGLYLGLIVLKDSYYIFLFRAVKSVCKIISILS